MLQARYWSCVELNLFVVQMHLNYYRRKQSSLFLFMPVLCGVTQSKVASQNYNILKSTRLQLLPTILMMLISYVLIHHILIGHQLKTCDYFTSVMMFEAIHGLTTPCLRDLIVSISETHHRNTRKINSFEIQFSSVQFNSLFGLKLFQKIQFKYTHTNTKSKEHKYKGFEHNYSSMAQQSRWVINPLSTILHHLSEKKKIFSTYKVN